MINATRSAIAVMVWLALIALPAYASDWRTYKNARFGTSAKVPAHGFTAEPPSLNGDGQTWISQDGQGQILVFGDLIVTVDSTRDYRQEVLDYAREDGVDIVYNVAKKNWFAYSGFLGDDIVYEKVIVTTGCDPMIGNHVYFRYPASQKSRYDEIVRRAAASLGGSSNAAMCN
jgi:hypothetical protein